MLCYLFAVFNVRLLFFYVGQLGGTATYLVYPISDVAENLGRFLVRSVYIPGESFWIDSNGKTETRHPTSGIIW